MSGAEGHHAYPDQRRAQATDRVQTNSPSERRQERAPTVCLTTKWRSQVASRKRNDRLSFAAFIRVKPATNR
jgi:hypothetical protein